MSLIWHIVRKDFRRMAGPLALWLLLVLGHILLLFVWDGPADINPVSYEGKRYFLNGCGVVVMGLGFILAAWLVMEDNLVSPAAFWRTRPIHGLRLLAAKALGALLMFSVLPAVALGPVWLGCGFSPRELAAAAVELGGQQAGCSLLALVLGALAEDVGQFLRRTLVVLLLLIGLAFVLGPNPGLNRLYESRALVLSGLQLATLFGVLLNQFLTRGTNRSLVFVAVGYGLMLLTVQWWPWEITSPPAPRPADSPASLAVRLGELPLKPGAELRVGSSLTRIKSVRDRNGNIVVVLEERDAWIKSQAGAYSAGYDPARRHIRPFADRFEVQAGPRRLAPAPGIEEIGTVMADSIVVGRRNLVLVPPDGAGADWLAGAILVKSRAPSNP